MAFVKGRNLFLTGVMGLTALLAAPSFVRYLPDRGAFLDAFVHDPRERPVAFPPITLPMTARANLHEAAAGTTAGADAASNALGDVTGSIGDMRADKAILSPSPLGEPTQSQPVVTPALDDFIVKRSAAGARLAYAPPDSWRLPAERMSQEPPISATPDRSALTSDKIAPVKGAALFVRVFKKEGVLELWAQRDGRYRLHKTYPICKWSGHLGPKIKEADYQSPEGFYAVSSKQLRPDSAYHRAFNIGYPNAFDKQNGRTGGLIMVHGDCKSVGCFAMTNKGIEEIYGFVEAALRNGQKDVPVHIFPFRMTQAAIARESSANVASLFSSAGAGLGSRDWGDFWRNLKDGYDIFERTGAPPTVFACQGKYRFGVGGPGCTRVAGW